MNHNDQHDVWRDYFLARAIRERGLPALPLMERACSDCAVKTGFYKPISKKLKTQRKDVQVEISSKWFCHTDQSKCCRGNAEFLGIVEDLKRHVDPAIKRCVDCGDELVLVSTRKELVEFGSLPLEYHYCQRCKSRTDG